MRFPLQVYEPNLGVLGHLIIQQALKKLLNKDELRFFHNNSIQSITSSQKGIFPKFSEAVNQTLPDSFKDRFTTFLFMKSAFDSVIQN